MSKLRSTPGGKSLHCMDQSLDKEAHRPFLVYVTHDFCQCLMEKEGTVSSYPNLNRSRVSTHAGACETYLILRYRDCHWMSVSKVKISCERLLMNLILCCQDFEDVKKYLPLKTWSNSILQQLYTYCVREASLKCLEVTKIF